MGKYTLLIKLTCRIQLFNLDDHLLQMESRQILFSNFETFQIYVNSNLYKRVCLWFHFPWLQDPEVSSTVWMQILKLLLHFLDSSFLLVMQGCYFLEKIAPLLENTILWHMDSQNKRHFLLSGLSPEHSLSRKLKIVEFL